MTDVSEEIVRRRPGRPPRGERSELREEKRILRTSDEFGDFSDFDNHSVLPYVPDTKEWHYCWVRVSLQGVLDGKNLQRHQTGAVRYEPVHYSEMPGLVNFKATNANAGGDVIQIDDVVLMRCPRRMHEKRMAHYAADTAKQSAMLKQDTKKQINDQRVTFTYTDNETSSLVDGGEE